MSNILELNNKLYDLLNDLEDGKADVKKAQAMVNVSNAIHNNVKLTLQVAKLTGNAKVGNLLLGMDSEDDQTTPTPAQVSKAVALRKEEFQKKLAKAKELGYSTVEEAHQQMGKHKFNEALKAVPA